MLSGMWMNAHWCCLSYLWVLLLCMVDRGTSVPPAFRQEKKTRAPGEGSVCVMSARTLGCDISFRLLVTSQEQRGEGHPYGSGRMISLCMCGAECVHAPWEEEEEEQEMEPQSKRSLERDPHFLVV